MKILHRSLVILNYNIYTLCISSGFQYDCILSMMVTAFCVFSGDYIVQKKWSPCKQAKLLSVWVLWCVFRLLNWETFLSHQERAKDLYPVWVILCVFGWIYWEIFFHTRRRQRDCVLCISSNVSLQASRQEESHVTPEAWKGPMGSLCLFWWLD